MSLCLTTDSPNATLALGRRFSTCLAAGDVVLLSGRLGVGKTLFVQGVAEGLGIEERITSPSFVISRTYRDGFKLYRTSHGWRCAEHSEIRNASLHRPLTDREARADAESRSRSVRATWLSP